MSGLEGDDLTGKATSAARKLAEAADLDDDEARLVRTGLGRIENEERSSEELRRFPAEAFQTHMPVMRDWYGLIAVETERTIDGRLVQVGALSWKLPVPVMLLLDAPESGGHEGAIPVGQILTIQRWGPAIVASGELDVRLLIAAGGLSEKAVEPTQIGCGVDLDLVEAETTTTASEIMSDQYGYLMLVKEARVMGLTLYGGTEPATTAWPSTSVLIGGADG